MDKFCEYYANDSQKLLYSTITEKRKRIVEKVRRAALQKYGGANEITAQNFKNVMTEDILKMMLEHVDREFFDNKLVETFEKNGCCLTLCFNNRCTSLAGRCSYWGKQLKLEMMNNVFIKSFKKTDLELRAVDNIPCKDILTCYFLTFCHELVHGIVFCNCLDFDKTDKGPGSWKGVTRPGNGHSKTFMSILNNRFGHQKFTHNLNTGITVARLESPIFGSHNIKKGDIVILEVRKRDKTRENE